MENTLCYLLANDYSHKDGASATALPKAAF